MNTFDVALSSTDGDVLARFLADVTEVDETSAMSSRELFTVFEVWCTERGIRPRDDQAFWRCFKLRDLMTSGTVTKPSGVSRLGGRDFSTLGSTPLPEGPSRLLLGLKFRAPAGVQ